MMSFTLICRYHSLLKSLKNLIGKTKSSHLKMLLDKHCPVLLLQEDALKSGTTSQVDIFLLEMVFIFNFPSVFRLMSFEYFYFREVMLNIRICTTKRN